MAHSSVRPSLVAITACVPLVAHANAGIGFFMPASISLVLAMIPVIVIEGVVLARGLAVGAGRGQWLSLCANLVSTIAGGIIGFALDLAIGSVTGSLGSAGKTGVLFSLAMMFWISWVIEALAVRRMTPAATAGRVWRATLIANLITYALLAAFVAARVAHDGTPVRSQMTEVVNAAGVARTEAAEHYQTHGRWPATVQSFQRKHVRSVRIDEAGRIVAVIRHETNEEVDGKTLVYEPVLKGGAIAEWRCYVPEAPLKYFPATCRFRNAKDP